MHTFGSLFVEMLAEATNQSQEAILERYGGEAPHGNFQGLDLDTELPSAEAEAEAREILSPNLVLMEIWLEQNDGRRSPQDGPGPAELRLKGHLEGLKNL